MKYFPTLSLAIDYARNFLVNTGQVITTESWQGVKKPIDMFESFDLGFKCPCPTSEAGLIEQCRPNLNWAREHFNERISGIPYNPPPSAERWPYSQNNHAGFKNKEKFSHTYPERFWPKFLMGNRMQLSDDHVDYDHCRQGIRFDYGDLNDVIKLLKREPHTRQAYLPVWFPEDTGAVEGQRVPCTLGYLFRILNGHIHITYKIRSCDYLRHFRDDVYMAISLLVYVAGEINSERGQEDWLSLGMFKFQADSFHVFAHEKDVI